MNVSCALHGEFHSDTYSISPVPTGLRNLINNINFHIAEEMIPARGVTADDFGMTRRGRPIKLDVDAFFDKLRALDPGRDHWAIPTWGDENQLAERPASANKGLEEEGVTESLEDGADNAQNIGSAWETEKESMTAQGFTSTSQSQEEMIRTEEVKGVEIETMQAQNSGSTSESEGPTVQTHLNLVKESPTSTWPPEEKTLQTVRGKRAKNETLQVQKPVETTDQTQIANATGTNEDISAGWPEDETVEIHAATSTEGPEKETVGTQAPDSCSLPEQETTEKHAVASTLEPTVTAGTSDTREVVKADFIGNNRPLPDSFAVETFFAKLRQQDGGGEELVGWDGNETAGGDDESKGWW